MTISTEAGTNLGTWKNPPLAYVVAELALSVHYGISSKIGAVQELLRRDYPRTAELSEVVLAAPPTPSGLSQQPPSPQPRWYLFDSMNSRAVDIGPRTLGLHATAYTNSDDFLGRWDRVLAAIEQSNLELFVERAGLRYVDLINPSDGRRVADYVQTSLADTVGEAEESIQHCLWSRSTVVDGFVVQSSTATPAPRGMVLPPNLNTAPLQVPTVLATSQARAQARARTGWIDTDVSQDMRQAFDRSAIAEAYRRMHDLASQSFKKLASPAALEEWM